jgi:two-component system sensor histidine kinase/response regulator
MTANNILIVEDSITQAEQLKYILEQNNYNVTRASSAEEALTIIEDFTPTLIISDIVMPGMTGYQLCEKIKHDEKLKVIPVILLTALSDIKDIIQGLDCGADSFIVKPYSESFLISRISDLLDNNSLNRPVKEMNIGIYFKGEQYWINSSPSQIVQLLLSTYENTIQRNTELQQLNNELLVAQRELRKKNILLEKINEQKNYLLGMAAHDLRNPLGIIQTYSDFLIEEIAALLNREQLDLIESIKSSSEFMLHLVNEMLDFSNIESGKVKLNLEKTDLVELVGHNIQLNKSFSEKKNIKIVYNSENTIPPMIIDKYKIQQVLNNLVSNAIKFSYPDTKIEVSVRRKENNVIISVRDEGQGIPGNELVKLFTPFEKTSVKSTGGERSTGLGLAIAKKIVDSHNGTIWVESEVGKGSVFYIQLPLKGEEN